MWSVHKSSLNNKKKERIVEESMMNESSKRIVEDWKLVYHGERKMLYITRKQV